MSQCDTYHLVGWLKSEEEGIIGLWEIFYAWWISLLQRCPRQTVFGVSYCNLGDFSCIGRYGCTQLCNIHIVAFCSFLLDQIWLERFKQISISFFANLSLTERVVEMRCNFISQNLLGPFGMHLVYYWSRLRLSWAKKYQVLNTKGFFKFWFPAPLTLIMHSLT